MKFRIVALTLVIVIGVGIYLYTQNLSSNPMHLISTIEPLLGPDKTPTMDYHDDLGIDGIQDLGIKVDQDGTYHLYYGNVDIPLVEKDFSNEDLIHALGRIGITVFRDKETGELVFKYLGEEIEKLSGSY